MEEQFRPKERVGGSSPSRGTIVPDEPLGGLPPGDNRFGELALPRHGSPQQSF
jgi:hypothetical protein